MNIEWHGDKVLERTNSLLEDVSLKVAKNVMADSKRILKQKAKTTTERGLLSQFSISKSKFKNGGYVVSCQGSKNWRKPYHASFLEMGTYKDQAKPFMRPGTKKNKSKANKMYRDGLKKL